MKVCNHTQNDRARLTQHAGRKNGQQQAGSVMMVVVIGVAIMGISLSSYLGLVSSQNLSIARSQTWNSAIPVAEAGIEEAMAYLNGDTNRLRDGWILTGTNWTKSRTVGDNKYTMYVSAAVRPLVTVRAFALAPLQEHATEKKYVERTVQVTTTNRSMFVKGMVALGNITLGGTIRTDSFDSDVAPYDPAKPGDKGDVASNGSVENVVAAGGTVDIYGHVSTGPNGTVSLNSPNVSIGSTAWHDGGNTGIEPGWSTDDMNVWFPSVDRPFTGGAFMPMGGNVGGTNYAYVLASGNYQMTSLSMASSQKMIVTGNATLLVPGNVSISGQAFIYVAPGATLRLYGGGVTTIAGGGVANSVGKAANFLYYGLPSNVSVTLSGTTAFNGVIYAPYSDFYMAGGGNSTVNFTGASTTKTVDLSGKYNFHYDEALSRMQPAKYHVTTWNEVAWK